jgi:CRISPR-associated protein Cas1
MATLFVDRSGVVLSRERDAVVIRYQEGDLRRFPMRALDRVVVWGAATIETGLMVALAERGIPIALHSGRGAGGNALVHGHGPHAGLLRVNQIRLLDDPIQRTELAKTIVHAKLVAQYRFMAKLRKARPDRRLILTRALREIDSAVHETANADSVARLLGLEGAGASAYWNGFGSVLADGLGFVGRMRRPPPDPVNSSLSLGYTCLVNEAASVCITVGIDPAVGALHNFVRRRPSLACDLVEPLRTDWDRRVYGLFRDGKLRPDHFQNRSGSCIAGPAGRGILYAEIAKTLRASRRWFRRQLYAAIARSRPESVFEGELAGPSEDIGELSEEFDD